MIFRFLLLNYLLFSGEEPPSLQLPVLQAVPVFVPLVWTSQNHFFWELQVPGSWSKADIHTQYFVFSNPSQCLSRHSVCVHTLRAYVEFYRTSGDTGVLPEVSLALLMNNPNAPLQLSVYPTEQIESRSGNRPITHMKFSRFDSIYLLLFEFTFLLLLFLNSLQWLRHLHYSGPLDSVWM